MQPVDSKEKLESLPGSEDKDFWLEADIHTGITPHNEFANHGHYFERSSGRSAQCVGCGWGFELDPGDTVEDGHLYDSKGKLII
jgi:hypothetical protein